MKKFFTVILTAALFLLGACSAPPAVSSKALPKPPCTFEGDCTVTYREMQIKAHIIRSGEQNCKISVTAPDTLKDVELDYENGAIVLSYGLLKQTLDVEKIPQAAFAPAIVSAFDEITSAAVENGKYENGEYTYSVSSSNGVFTVVSDEATGNLKKIEIPQYEMLIVFDTFSKIG